MYFTGKHRASRHENGRYIDSCRSHEESRNVLIAVRNHHETVKLVCLRHTLRGIGNQVSCNKRILHADVPHRNPVADRNGGKLYRETAGLRNPHFHRLRNLVQIHVPRHNFVVGANHTDHRLLHLFLGKSQGIHQTSVGRLLHALPYMITNHLNLLNYNKYTLPLKSFRRASSCN